MRDGRDWNMTGYDEDGNIIGKYVKVLNSNHLNKKTVVYLGATTYFTSVWTGKKKGGWIQ